MTWRFLSQVFVVFSVLVAAAVALPAGPPPPGYHPEKQAPHPYAYQYGVNDDYSGTTFDKTESQDDYGNVQGEYKIQLPDGRLQIVTYTANHEQGFVADVKYEGTPVYPEAPKGGYGPKPHSI